jgi:hypothetical protein
MVTQTASDTEAAAIVAALEQFLAETAPAPALAGPTESPWQRAALREAISARTEHWAAPRAPKSAPATPNATNRRREWP